MECALLAIQQDPALPTYESPETCARDQEPFGYLPLAEYEKPYQARQSNRSAPVLKQPSLRRTRVDSERSAVLTPQPQLAAAAKTMQRRNHDAPSEHLSPAIHSVHEGMQRVAG